MRPRKVSAQGAIHNEINGGIFFSAVIQGHDITVQLPPEVTPALFGLPIGSDAFTGRESDLRHLLTSLAPYTAGSGHEASAGEPLNSSPIVVTAVGGMGGVGKTELAIQAAHIALKQGWFPGGVLCVDLFGYDPVRCVDPGHALEGFLRALGIPGEHIPPDPQDRTRLYASVLATYAQAGRPILVVIDNASSAEQARPLLPPGQGCRAIVTSRHTLGMLGARLLDLNVLSPYDAVELLDRAIGVARSGDTRVTDHLDDAFKVVALCGYLPLALQIIAALLAEDPTRTLSTMAADLDDARSRLEEMAYDEVTVQATFDLSYQQLGADQARLFRLLPVNLGPDISSTAAAVLARQDSAVVRRLLEALSRAHLIERGSAYGRWRMHDLVRLYAEQHGRTHADADGREQAVTALLEHYLSTTRAASRHLDPTASDSAASGFLNETEALAWLDGEYPNLAAIVYTTAADDLYTTVVRDLPLALADFLLRRRMFADAIALHTHSLRASRRLSDPHREGAALNNLGIALAEMRRFDEAIAAHATAASIHRENGDRHDEGRAVNSLGTALAGVGRFDEAITAHTTAASIFQEIGDRYGEGLATNGLGIALRRAGCFDEAITAYNKAITIHQETGHRHGEGLALNNLGSALRQMGGVGERISQA